MHWLTLIALPRRLSLLIAQAERKPPKGFELTRDMRLLLEHIAIRQLGEFNNPVDGGWVPVEALKSCVVSNQLLESMLATLVLNKRLVAYTEDCPAVRIREQYE